MIGLSTSLNWRARLPGSLGSLLVLVIIAAACGGDATGLSTEAALPADSIATAPTDTIAGPADTITAPPSDTVTTPDSTVPPPTDSTTPPPVDSTAPGETIVPAVDRSSHPGITFGTFAMRTPYLSSVHTGTLLGGPLSPTTIVSVLAEARRSGGRMVVKLCMGSDHYVKGPDGTFSFTKWKALVDRWRSVDLAPFIADGTIVGHYLIDEPGIASRWGGKIIPQATLEAMAAYSKQIWPTMTTFVRVVPSWLAGAPVKYTHLDAGWLQYTANKGDAGNLITAEIAVAKRLGLGLMTGMNVMNGGNGSSRIPGLRKGHYMMSAAEIRNYGTVLLNQSYACGFFMWQYNASYYDRPDIKAAMSELSVKARSNVKTSCRQ